MISTSETQFLSDMNPNVTPTIVGFLTGLNVAECVILVAVGVSTLSSSNVADFHINTEILLINYMQSLASGDRVDNQISDLRSY